MASMWGRAWGDSWGLSWGLTYEANQDDLTITGGIGHGKGGKRKRRFVERDGKILVFETAEDAARFVESEQKPVKRKKKAKPKPIPQPVEIIEWKRLETLANAYPEANYSAKVYRASLDEDYARLVAIYHKLLEIEDEEILLLSA